MILAENGGVESGSLLFQIRKAQIIIQIIMISIMQTHVGTTDDGEIRNNEKVNSMLIIAAIKPSYVLKKAFN